MTYRGRPSPVPNASQIPPLSCKPKASHWVVVASHKWMLSAFRPVVSLLSSGGALCHNHPQRCSRQWFYLFDTVVYCIWLFSQALHASCLHGDNHIFKACKPPKYIDSKTPLTTLWWVRATFEFYSCGYMTMSVRVIWWKLNMDMIRGTDLFPKLSRERTV